MIMNHHNKPTSKTKSSEFSLLFLQLRCLHEQGYSLLSLDAIGQTGLHYASEYNHKDIVKYFILYAPWEIINMAEKNK